jgi:hypothetical protein
VLPRIATLPAQLSSDRDLDRCPDRMREHIVALRRTPFRSAARFRILSRRPSLLRVEDDFAYHPGSIG